MQSTSNSRLSGILLHWGILYQIRFLFLGRSAWYNKVRFGEDERKCSYACVGKLAGVFEPLKPDDLVDGRFVFIKSYLS